ncbi:restriction endonuclease [Thiocystis violacea]|uniref:restriction endonuclease n=1 Tax=Thiocystis violacea TaxID=13725 RepID=UPI001908680A|nr:restriction endonuclease [Thiocystis violacea]
MSDFDPNIDPVDYEHYCAKVLRGHGWDVRTTQATGDHGVDVIASKNGRKGAIQCKRYSSPVGNKAVQEVCAGMRYIGGSFCAVVSNADYTRSAKQLAQSLGVLLLHHDELRLLEEKILN